ncbi:2-(1,2-epoxy-1,2-dihydrophenyl)acetyl-CoA isomerase [Sphingobium faniae]|nr:2-(1,2-epoxy-1,2-dihydrophenyl)acetyl-CoA isomerase [Sphingobium faniae]
MGILTQQHGAGVVEVTLDWPDILNAMGPEQARATRAALEAAFAREGVGAVILSANGKGFCAGGNLPAIVKLAEDGPDAVRKTIYGEFQALFRVIRSSPVPVITAVDGAAVGFGCDLALAGSATFIGERGWLRQGWNQVGLIPATGGAHYVAERGGAQAIWRMLAADRVDGATADAWGLGIACANARAAALEMADRIAALPLPPLKALTALSRIGDEKAHLAAALDYQAGFITHPDFAESAARMLRK